MRGMEWRLDPDPQGRAPYLRIVALLERAIEQGQLRPGDRLPSQRSLAQQLGVDLTTVTRAFGEAKQRGLVDARGPQGSFVAPPKVEVAHTVDLSMNIPPQPAGFDLPLNLRRGLAQVIARSDAASLMTYHRGGGNQADRKAAQRWLAPWCGHVPTERIVVTPGAQAALAMLIACATGRDDVILCEPHTYPGLLSAATVLGRPVQAVAADEHGMRPDALEQQLRRNPRALLYLNPTAQNPNARTMPLQRRQELAKVIQAHALLVIEDDPYQLLTSAEPPPPLLQLVPEHVCHVSTLAKCLTPGLRTAFVVLPPRLPASRMQAALHATHLMAAPLTTALATQWLLDGTANELLAQVQEESRERCAIARTLFTGSKVSCDGIQLWHPLPRHWPMAKFEQAAQQIGLSVATADSFATPGAEPIEAIRVSLGSAGSRSELTSALRRLDQLIQQRPQ